MKTHTLPIINTDEAYRGSIRSFAYLGKNGLHYVAHSSALYNNCEGDLTLAQYKEKVSSSIKVITWKTLQVMDAEYQKTLITEPSAITPEYFNDMFGVLPPKRVQDIDGWFVFHMQEIILADLVYWYASKGPLYYEFTDSRSVTPEHILQKLENRNKTNGNS